MTGKIKAAIALVLVSAALAGGFRLGRQSRERMSREAELASALSEERKKLGRAEREKEALRQSMSALADQEKKPPEQKSQWQSKTTGKKTTETPPACEECLARVKREIEVKDDANGWWIYRDDDVLDDSGGRLTLTPRFFEDMVLPADPENEIGVERGEGKNQRSGLKNLVMAPPEKAVRAGVGLAAYELEISYDPVVVQSGKATLSMGVRSRLLVDRLDSELRGELSAGVEVRW